METLRYYERIGLLPPPVRTRAGRRLYDRDTIALLESIRVARSLGLSIADILSLLAPIRDDRGADETLVASLERALEHALERTISELTRLGERRTKLEALLTDVRAGMPSKESTDRVRRAWRRGSRHSARKG